MLSIEYEMPLMYRVLGLSKRFRMKVALLGAAGGGVGQLLAILLTNHLP